MPSSVGDNSSGAPVVSKDKKFKRIRGLLGGERKEKKEKKAREKKSSSKSQSKKDDDETYQVNVEERSIATAPPKQDDDFRSDGKNSYMLKVVLLLMDPKSRRFELLQLEFDSLKALVSDVMAQIPVSVTEEVLRKQTYLGICGHDGKEMPLNVLLAQFCKGNNVLVAVPQGVPAQECARLALPILTDSNVVDMLRSSDIDVSAWIDSKNKKVKRSLKPSSQDNSKMSASEVDSNEGGSAKTVTFILVVLAAIFLQVFHLYISAPIKPGHIVSPGIQLSKCGILSFMPTCSNAYMSFEDEATIVLKDGSNNLIWEIKGGVCRKGDKGCIRGMKVGEDGGLTVGGRVVNTVSAFQDNVELAPWPFAQPPRVRVKRDNVE